MFLDCSLEVLIQRDPKGLYRKAQAGEIENFSGISDVYDVPAKPEIAVRTDIEGPGESAGRIISWLDRNGYLA